MALNRVQTPWAKRRRVMLQKNANLDVIRLRFVASNVTLHKFFINSFIEEYLQLLAFFIIKLV